VSPILGIFASQGRVASSSYESIATFNGTGSSSTITFSSIPSTYKHLQIRMLIKSTYTGQSTSYMYPIRCNGDSTTSYSMHALRSNGSSVSAYGNGSRDNMFAYDFPANSMTNNYGVIIMDILDYADTNKYKTLRFLQGFDNNGSGEINLLSGSWQKTDAITSISLGDNYANWATNTSFALYGIKG
jgi:hypothetical protein